MQKDPERLSWDFGSLLILMIFGFLQIFRWQLYPLYMDIYYHLHTAWGFIQAGGYSGWDFWQYAPGGRPHLYPPLIHIILALLMKIGVDKLILAKFLEAALPVLFLFVFWHFVRCHYGKELGFFALVMSGSSFSFFSTLVNHLPATLALSFAVLSAQRMLKKDILRSWLLLGLCFYTHTSVAWFIALSFMIFAWGEPEYRTTCLWVIAVALVVSLPMHIKQLAGFSFYASAPLAEKYITEFKPLDYVCAFAGIGLSLQLAKKYKLFAGFLLASPIFFIHPYRFFSGEGFLPVILLSALALREFFNLLKGKNPWNRIPVVLGVTFFFISPTVILSQRAKSPAKIYTFDSVIMNLVFAQANPRVTSTTHWLPNEYLPVVRLIEAHSSSSEIVYAPLPNVSVTLASLAGRASSSALFPDIGPSTYADPVAVSRVIVMLKEYQPEESARVIKRYDLKRIGENKLFEVYTNPSVQGRMQVRPARLRFRLLLPIILLIILFLWQPQIWKKSLKKA